MAQALRKGEELPTSTVESTSKYRDVLKAAWACRLLHPDRTSVGKIAKQAKPMCDVHLQEAKADQYLSAVRRLGPK